MIAERNEPVVAGTGGATTAGADAPVADASVSDAPVAGGPVASGPVAGAGVADAGVAERAAAAAPVGARARVASRTADVVARATRAQRLAALVGLAIAVWLALRLFASILMPFVAASGIAYFLHPVCSRLARAGLGRGTAAFLVILGLLAACLVAVLLLYPLAIAQVAILVGRIPSYAIAIRHLADVLIADAGRHLGRGYVNEKLRDLVATQAGTVIAFLGGTLGRIVGGGFALFNVLSLALITPVVAFYLLRDWPTVIGRLDLWLPRRYAASVRAQAGEVDRILSAWVRGQLVCCVFLALFYAVGLSLAGLDLGLIVGLLSGGLSFIPYVGTITGAVSSISLALAQFPNWHGVALVAAVFVAGQLLEGYVILPRFLGDRVELHAVWVIFALFAGGAALGFVGVMLAVPIAATIGVLARYWLARYLTSPLYLDPDGA